MNYIQKIVEDFNFNSIKDGNDKGIAFAENALGVVNLDLPSETLWCKCNLGANKETEYGGYYAWGELITKSEYTKENYTYNDNPKQLPPEYDVATQTLGNHYSIPTSEQWDELLKYTTNEWVKNYNNSGVSGRLFVARNGNTLFIPAAGIHNNSSLDEKVSHGGVWSSSIDTDEYNWVWYLGFRSFYASMYSGSRHYGLSVRPVFKK